MAGSAFFPVLNGHFSPDERDPREIYVKNIGALALNHNNAWERYFYVSQGFVSDLRKIYGDYLSTRKTLNDVKLKALRCIGSLDPLTRSSAQTLLRISTNYLDQRFPLYEAKFSTRQRLSQLPSAFFYPLPSRGLGIGLLSFAGCQGYLSIPEILNCRTTCSTLRKITHPAVYAAQVGEVVRVGDMIFNLEFLSPAIVSVFLRLAFPLEEIPVRGLAFYRTATVELCRFLCEREPQFSGLIRSRPSTKKIDERACGLPGIFPLDLGSF